MVTAVIELRLEWPLSELTGVVARVDELRAAENMEWVSADSAVSDQASSSIGSTEFQSSWLVGGVGWVTLRDGIAVGVCGDVGVEYADDLGVKNSSSLSSSRCSTCRVK